MYYILKRTNNSKKSFIEVRYKGDDIKKGVAGFKWVNTFKEATPMPPETIDSPDFIALFKKMKLKSVAVWMTDKEANLNENDFWLVDKSFIHYIDTKGLKESVESAWITNPNLSEESQPSQVDNFLERIKKNDEQNVYKSFQDIPTPFSRVAFGEIMRDTNILCVYNNERKEAMPMLKTMETASDVDIDSDSVLNKENISLETDSLLEALTAYHEASPLREAQLKEQLVCVQQGVLDIVEYLTSISTELSSEDYIQIGTVLQKLLVARNCIKLEYAKIQLVNRFLNDPEKVNIQETLALMDARTYKPRVLTELFDDEGRTNNDVDIYALRDAHSDIIPKKQRPLKKPKSCSCLPSNSVHNASIRAVPASELVQRMDFKVERILKDETFPFYYKQLKRKKLLDRYVANVYNVSIQVLRTAMKEYEIRKSKPL